MAIFEGCQIVLDLTTSVRFKEKTELRKAITGHGGVVSFIVTKKSTHVICNDAEKADISYKCRMGLKYGIPVVSMEFIWQSVSAGQLQNTDGFLVAGQSKSDSLKEGKIAATRYQKRDKKKEIKPYVNVGAIKVWKENEKNLPEFAQNAQLAKFAMFQGEKKVKGKEDVSFAVLEVHVDEAFSNSNSGCRFKYRVVSHTGLLHTVEARDKGSLEYRFCTSVDEALTVYNTLYKEQQQQQGMRVVHDVFSRHIGSNIFKQMMGELGLETETMTAPVEELVEHVWREAQGELENILSVPATSINLEQIEKAEAVLKQLKALIDSKDGVEISRLLKEFYDTLPHHTKTRELTKAWLSRKQDICQLVKDMISVSEATDWSTRSSVQSKYKALRCGIHHLHRTSPEYLSVKQQVLDTLIGNSVMEVRNIFAVNRPVEAVNFTNHISPKQLMFHASKADNMVGILSRGLLMPRVVVDDHGGTRSDPGMLGSGIYFASAASTSIGYSLPSTTKGSRFMLVNEVALGNCKDVYSKDLTLTSPPEGYNSVHGVRSSETMTSDFKNDEYVIYNTNQQCIRYLVEFTIPMDIYLPIEDMPSILETEEMEEDLEDKKQISLKDVRDIEDPLTKVKPGLVATGDAAVNLKAVHIRAKLVDLASEVVVLQHYENNSKTAVEAKYVFPLGDMAAVCGFEAFINGKHIVGEVKEKETAHREYKKAISEGHGAYLMDQDEETPDVFTVSVGNLPPGACVLIKITYVAELQVEGEMISFRLPGSVAPWQKDSLKDVTQQETDTHEVAQGETTLQVAVDMPFDIRTLECTTHKIRLKKTLSKATVELLPEQSLADGFQLLIGLAEIHVPRMWVERKTGNQEHQACMLTFYPQFEACETEDVNVIILLDLSNSMKGDNLINAKKVVLLTLEHLPSSWNFNIVVFGTAFKELFPICVRKTSANVKLASDFVLGLTADLGNTEAVRPMHTFYLLKSENSIQNVFLVSDGHINNEEVMLAAANKNSQHTRLFTMGVSSTANRHALRALARVGAGAYEYFDAKVKSKWEIKVKSHINKAAQPGLTSVTVDWEQHGADVELPVQAPKQITALFSGSRQVIYGFVPNCTMATLRAMIAGEEVSTMVSTSDLSITNGLILHRLTARAMISDWEDGILAPDRTDHEIVKMNTKDFIIDLSKEYSIVTQFTSFVAIEKRDKDEEKKAVDAPSMSELVEKENVDQLSYMGYEEDKAPNTDPEKTVDDILTSIRLNFNSKQRQRDLIEEGLEIADLIEDNKIRSKKIKELEMAFDEWNLDEDYSFTSEFARKRQNMPEKKNIVVTVSTMAGKTYRFAVNQLNTVIDIKAKMQDVEGTPIHTMRLMFQGKQLEDDKTLEECDIQDNAFIHVVLQLRGGGPDPNEESPERAYDIRRKIVPRAGRGAQRRRMSAGASRVLSIISSSSSDSSSEDCEEEGSKSKKHTSESSSDSSSDESEEDMPEFLGTSEEEGSGLEEGESDSLVDVSSDECEEELDRIIGEPIPDFLESDDESEYTYTAEAEQKKAKRHDSPEEEEEEDLMSFGLFDDDVMVTKEDLTNQEVKAIQMADDQQMDIYECLDFEESFNEKIENFSARLMEKVQLAMERSEVYDDLLSLEQEAPRIIQISENKMAVKEQAMEVDAIDQCLSLAQESTTAEGMMLEDSNENVFRLSYQENLVSSPSEVESGIKLTPLKKKKASSLLDKSFGSHTVYNKIAEPLKVVEQSSYSLSEPSVVKSAAQSLSDTSPPPTSEFQRDAPFQKHYPKPIPSPRVSSSSRARHSELPIGQFQTLQQAPMTSPPASRLLKASMIQPLQAPQSRPPKPTVGFAPPPPKPPGGFAPPPPPPTLGFAQPPPPPTLGFAPRPIPASRVSAPPPPPPSYVTAFSYSSVGSSKPPELLDVLYGATLPPPLPSRATAQPFGGSGFSFGAAMPQSQQTSGSGISFGPPIPPPQPSCLTAYNVGFVFSEPIQRKTGIAFSKAPAYSSPAPFMASDAKMAEKMGITKPRSLSHSCCVDESEAPNKRASLLSDIRQSRQKQSISIKALEEKMKGKEEEKKVEVHAGKQGSLDEDVVFKIRSQRMHGNLGTSEEATQGFKAKEPMVSWRSCNTRGGLLKEIPLRKTLKIVKEQGRKDTDRDSKPALDETLFSRNLIDLTEDVCSDDDDDDDWELELLEEPFMPLLEDTFVGFFTYKEDAPLYKYGIGFKIPSITVSRSIVTRMNSKGFINKLSVMKMWDLPQDLQQEMGIDFNVCDQLLKLAGVSSLGVKVKEELYPLLKMWIIIIFIFKLYVPEQLPTDFGDEDIVTELGEKAISSMKKDGIPDGTVKFIFKHCLDKFSPIEEKHGYLCNMLELGTSWSQLIGNMYHVHAKLDQSVRVGGGSLKSPKSADYCTDILVTV